MELGIPARPFQDLAGLVLKGANLLRKDEELPGGDVAEHGVGLLDFGGNIDEGE